MTYILTPHNKRREEYDEKNKSKGKSKRRGRIMYSSIPPRDFIERGERYAFFYEVGSLDKKGCAYQTHGIISCTTRYPCPPIREFPNNK